MVRSSPDPSPDRRRGLAEEDKAAWAAYTRHVAPLPGRAAPAGDPALVPEAATPPAAGTSPAPTRPGQTVRRAPAGPITVGRQPGGLDGSSWQKFRSGRLPAARRLDLHGFTAQRAFHAVLHFVRVAHADHVRCVEIVTGRGEGEGGVLRRELPVWLNLPEVRPLVLAAVHPHAANPGSVRLLLRRLR